jgi:EmrB/QacA subfamily drug resistance transporter
MLTPPKPSFHLSEDHPPVTERQAWKAHAALCVGLFMTLLDQSLVVVALPHLRDDLGASLNQAIWVSAVYLLTFAAPLLITGRLGDRFGQRNVYQVGMVIFILAAMACMISPNIETLIAARAVQGLGASLLNPQPLSIINRVFARNRRGAAMGVWSAVAGSAGLFGPVLGGLLVGAIGWRWVFVLYLPLGLISLMLVARWVPRLPTGIGRIDIFGALVSLIAVLGVVFTLQQGPELGWPVWIWGVLAGGMVAFSFFIWMQRRAHRRGSDALVPLELFTNRNFSLGTIAVAVLGFTVYSVNLPIMLYLQTGAALPPHIAGLMIMPMAIVSVTLAPFVGRWADRVAPGRLSIIGFSTMIAAMLLFVVAMRDGVPVGWVLVPLVMLGTANALCWSANSTITMRQLPAHLTGAGSGVYNTSRQVGAVVGAAALGAAMQIGIETTSFASAMGNAMLIPVVALVLGLVAVSNFAADTNKTPRSL